MTAMSSRLVVFVSLLAACGVQEAGSTCGACEAGEACAPDGRCRALCNSDSSCGGGECTGGYCYASDGAALDDDEDGNGHDMGGDDTLVTPGDDEEDTTPETTPTPTPTPVAAPVISSFSADRDLLPYDGGDVTFSFSVSGAQTLTLTGAGSLSPSSTSVVVPITAGATYTLTASNSGGTASSSVRIAVDAVPTVRGLVTNAAGEPLDGVLLYIEDHTAIAPTDGAFVIEDVARPYDLWVIDQASYTVDLYTNLTTLEPRLRLSVYAELPEGALHSASLGGTVTGAAIDDTTWTMAHVRTSGSASSVGNNPLSAFSFNPSWTGAGSTEGWVYAAQSKTSPFEITRFVERTVALSDGGSHSVELALSQVTLRSFSGTLSLESEGMAMSSLGLWSCKPGSVQCLQMTELYEPSTGEFTLKGFSRSGASYFVLAQGGNATGSMVRAFPATLGQSNLSVSLPPMPSVLAPGDGASLSTAGGDVIDWDSDEAFIYTVELTCADYFSCEGAWRYRVHTDSTSFTMPNLEAMGLVPPSGVQYYLGLSFIGDRGTLDEALLAGTPLFMADDGGPVFGGSVGGGYVTFYQLLW